MPRQRSAATNMLTVRVALKPNARSAEVIGDGPSLLVRVKAPPVDGRANAEAIALLAAAFGVPKNRVELAGGAASRRKRFRITDPATLPPGFQPE